ncbi:hypothetical protein b3_0346 [Synechococcus phage B3]|nr:hypothetical protein b3_0346 [Synechococcus phage B3]QGT54950.1 hypothetical protein b23_0340 [Synechococcus phage B23]
MEIYVRWIGGKYAEVHVDFTGGHIESGLLNCNEQVAYGAMFRELANELDPETTDD